MTRRSRPETIDSRGRTSANLAHCFDQFAYPFVRDKATDEYNIKVLDHIAVFFKDVAAVAIRNDDRPS